MGSQALIQFDSQEPVRCLILSGNEKMDQDLFWAAVRLGVGRLIVIGHPSSFIYDTNSLHQLGAEFFPEGTPAPAGPNVCVFKWEPKVQAPLQGQGGQA